LQGHLQKMPVHMDEGEVVHYHLPLDDQQISLNPLLGKKVSLEYLGDIHCLQCGRVTRKSYAQGYCYPCMKKLARCDSCIIKPELCHYAEGTCREPEWGKSQCFIPHVVYLANSSGLKVGITRAHHTLNRWIDQGAFQALPLLTVVDRLTSGQVEVLLKKQLNDRTDWRKMLRGEPPKVDLLAQRQRLQQEYGELPGTWGTVDKVTTVRYPVLAYPDKVRSHNLEKEPLLEGTLLGIKGQYLIFDQAVINIRKYTGYRVKFTADL
jgi:hypothetical protein